MQRGFLLVKAVNSDTTSPVASCTVVTVELDATGNGVLDPEDAGNTSTDNVGVEGYLACDKFFTCADLGSNMVEIEVYDAFGNKDTCMAEVTVVDLLAPVLSCPTDEQVTFDAGETFYTVPDYVALGTITASDNCSTSPSITQSPAPGTQLTAGNYFIEFEGTDDSSNVGICKFQLAVEVPLSVEDNNIATIAMFPNPAQNEFTVTATTIRSISIFDISGKLIAQESFDAVSRRTVDISQLSQGVYFVNINNSITKKLIKK
mgnify:CR=1 FL=1